MSARTRNPQTPVVRTARRRRPALLALVAASTCLGLLGLGGIFAAVQDRATTGENRYASEGVPENVINDLLIAQRDVDGTCGPFTNDLETGLFDVTAQADELSVPFVEDVCLQNAGLLVGDLSALVIDLDSREVDCTGREAEDDLTCAPGEEGELADVLSVFYRDCEDPGGENLGGGVLTEEQEPSRLVRMQPGDTVELCIRGGGFPEPPLRVYQSDRVTWRFAFDLTDADAGPVLCGEPQLDAEPNDQPGQGTTLSPFDLEHGSLCAGPYGAVSGDVDYFRFANPTGNPFEVIFTGEYEGMLDMGLYNGDVTAFLGQGGEVAPGVVRVAGSGSGLFSVQLSLVDPGDGVRDYTIEFRPLA